MTLLPLTFDDNGFFHLNSGESDYVGYSPDTYDDAIPIHLFVWMHGGGGEAEADLWSIAPPESRSSQSYIAVSLGGREDQYWDTDSDGPKLLAAVADVQRYFNIDPRTIYVGGYSSGGDMAYRYGFENAGQFAGILVENSDPFRDTGSTPAALMAAASWKINVGHVAHLSDDVYPIETVQASFETLTTNGFPVSLIELPGKHYAPDVGTTGTNYDLVHSLLPFLELGWVSPYMPLEMLSLMVPDAPAAGFTVVGSGFAPNSWIWITVDDSTDGTQPINGPDAFQPEADGTFTRTDPTLLSCGHTFNANAFVEDKIVATSHAVMPQCLPEPPPASETADVDATAATKAVYTDLVAAPARVDHRLVIGQALRGWDPEPGSIAEPVTALTNLGLPAPKLLEVDLTDFFGPNRHDAELFPLLISHAAQGGLIGLSFHAHNPFTGGDAYDTKSVDLPQLADPTNPQTPAGARWKAELDRIADVMQQFAAVDAVVLFRPLHESNGFWFWWGEKDPGPARPVDFRNTWQGMFRYLTTNRGLHNLLWVYSAGRDFGGALLDPTRLYPGNDLVDLVGLDIYDDDLSDAAPGEPGYAAMLALGKPFGITEYGAQGSEDDFHPGHDGAVHLPNDKVIRLIKDRYPRTVLASAWYSALAGNGESDNWQISDKPNPQALLLDPWAITL